MYFVSLDFKFRLVGKVFSTSTCLSGVSSHFAYISQLFPGTLKLRNNFSMRPLGIKRLNHASGVPLHRMCVVTARDEFTPDP